MVKIDLDIDDENIGKETVVKIEFVIDDEDIGKTSSTTSSVSLIMSRGSIGSDTSPFIYGRE